MGRSIWRRYFAVQIQENELRIRRPAKIHKEAKRKEF